jgi:peptide/nickel transport system substrate-binding protein
MTKPKFAIHHLITASILTVFITACGGEPSPTVPQTPAAPTAAAPIGDPVAGDWLIGRLASEPAHLNYLLDTADVYCFQLTRDVFDSLLTRDNETLELKPMLAESWEISDDQLMYTFKMREDAHFSDGVPVTAHDVKFTLDTILDEKNQTADKRNYYQDITKMEVEGDYTIRIHVSKRYYKHLSEIGDMFIFPKHIYGEGDINDHPNARSPIGSGPYVFESWETNQEIVFARNENYWNKDEMPHVLKRRYKVISNDESAFIELERQNIDYMALLPEQWVNRANNPEFDAKFNKHTYWASTGYVGGFAWIGWNMRKPQFADKRARQALTMLLDRQLVLDEMFHGLGRLVSGSESWQTTAYDQSIELWPFDPAAAKKLLDEAGWQDSNQNGIRDKDGVEFTYEFLMPSGSRELEQMATIYQEELKRAGIEMSIRPLEWASFIQFVTDRKFDACTMAWAIPVDSDPYQIWHSTQADAGSNYPGFQNATVDKIMEDARLEFDTEKRNAMYRELHAILHEEQPYTFLFSRQRLVAIDKRIQDVRVYPQGLYQLEWWTPANLQRYP